MEGPRPPHQSEYKRVLDFLDQQLRSEQTWSIADEYPTALTPSNIHNMRIIADDEKVLSHAVIKPLILKTPNCILKVAAIGSVVTEEAHRNQGLSRQILETCLDEASKQDCDLAILWTNLHDFYRKLGFELAGTEISFLIENEFQAPSNEYKFLKSNQVSPESIYRVYQQHTVTSFRSIEDVRKFMKIPQTQIYTAWDKSGQLAAYAVEGKGVDLTGYIHEWGGNVTALISLLSYIRKERQAALTIIVPQQSENLILNLQKHNFAANRGFLGMIKIIQHNSFFGKIKKGARALGLNDIVLEKNNDEFVFGFGQDLIATNDERALIRVLLGPSPEIDSFSDATRAKMKRILPLPFWLWGWDSV